jgi:hypothetical protein
MDGSSRANGERTMIIKRLAALMALGALLSTATPALALTVPGSVTVEWNYAITATMTMYTQTTSSATHATGSNDVLINANGGSGQCNGGTVTSSDTSSNGTVNYGNVVADATKYTSCYETNAIDLHYVTNDSKGADFTVQVTAGTAAGQENDYDTATNGSLLCIYPDGWTLTGTAVPTWTTSGTATAPVSTSTTACPGTGLAIPASAAASLYTATGGAANSGADLNQDLLLIMGPNMQSGQATLTVTYTLATN